MANRIAIPLADVCRQMRTAVGGNNTDIMNHFGFNGHVSGTLHNLQIAVVGRGNQRHYVQPGNTPCAQGKILWAIELVSLGFGAYFSQSLASVRIQRRNRPLRTHDDRSPPAPSELGLGSVEPEL